MQNMNMIQALNQALHQEFASNPNLVTFGEDVGHFGGVFRVTADEQVLWDRQKEGRFPEAKELKQRIRDAVLPEKQLGHSDR